MSENTERAPPAIKGNTMHNTNRADLLGINNKGGLVK